MSDNDLHNLRHAVREAPQGISDEFLTATRRGRPEHSGETEGVVIHVEAGEVSLTLDDGEELVFSESELRGALGHAA